MNQKQRTILLAHPVSKTVKCPNCSSQEVGRTKRIGMIDNLMSSLGLYPYYCHEYNCRKRFYNVR